MIRYSNSQRVRMRFIPDGFFPAASRSPALKRNWKEEHEDKETACCRILSGIPASFPESCSSWFLFSVLLSTQFSRKYFALTQEKNLFTKNR